ncbi:hypothetical protein EV426DRAFT_614553 [Tirmania nivea]|nr:hypothetical protein EV426DRAFT_614553 [Tirmania nivea]
MSELPVQPLGEGDTKLGQQLPPPPPQHSVVYISSSASPSSSPSSPFLLPPILSIFAIFQVILVITIYHFPMYVNAEFVLALAAIALAVMACTMAIFWRLFDLVGKVGVN